MAYGEFPFGLNDIKLTDISGTTQVDLPNAQRITFNPVLITGNLRGDDKRVASVARMEALEWEMDAGGISLEALAIITGKTVVTEGATPNETKTITVEGGDNMPYFKIYGKSLGDGDDDVHVLIFKAKCLNYSGNFQDAQFWITSMSGEAVDDGTNGIYDIVQNETAADLPAT
jgi:hypothetical protein